MPVKPICNQNTIQRVTLNIQEAAAYCGLSVDTFRRIVKSGEIVYRKVGVRYLFTRENLDKWLSVK